MSARETTLRVFVVGVPRSGTTLVQSLLAAHPALHSFTESHFFSRHWRALPLLRAAVLRRDPRPRLVEFLAENEVPEEIAAEALARYDAEQPRWLPFGPLRSNAAAAAFLRRLDELALLAGCTGWVEKTPRHLRYAGWLERVSGHERRTRVVHVVRDGLETVASLRAASRHWERPYDLDECVRRWNADVAYSVGRIGRLTDRYVLYEELTERPEPTLRRLLTELELDWRPGLLERHAEGAARLVTREERWKAKVAGAVRPSATSGHALSEAERARARAALRPELYERVRAHLAAREAAHAG